MRSLRYWALLLPMTFVLGCGGSSEPTRPEVIPPKPKVNTDKGQGTADTQGGGKTESLEAPPPE